MAASLVGGKRARTASLNDCASDASLLLCMSRALPQARKQQQLVPGSPLLCLPPEVLEQILVKLDAASLSRVAQSCSSFDGRLLGRVACSAVRSAAGSAQAGRWRRRSWLSRLYIEDAGVGFEGFAWSGSSSAATPSPSGSAGGGASPRYRFLPPTSPESFLHIKLDGMGPKLLVSDLSTADQPVLRWRLVVRGNTAVEFGVVPLSMAHDDKALHKCQQEEKKFERLAGPLVDAERPTGFCSSITVGSMLPFKTAIMKGSVVELLAQRGRLEILVQNPPDGQELYWHNTRTVPKPYKGPLEVRFEQDFSPHHDVKLALTSWAHGAFDVLHPAPGSRLLGPDSQRAWHLTAGSCSSGSSSSSGVAGPSSSSKRLRLGSGSLAQQAPLLALPPPPASTLVAAAVAAAQQLAGGSQLLHPPGSPGSDDSTASRADSQLP